MFFVVSRVLLVMFFVFFVLVLRAILYLWKRGDSRGFEIEIPNLWCFR